MLAQLAHRGEELVGGQPLEQLQRVEHDADRRARAASTSVATSMPHTSIRPASGRTRPTTDRSVVDLPLPLGPTSP